MIMNWMAFEKDKWIVKIHPTQKPINLLEKLIKIFTDEWENVFDPVAWSWTTLVASQNTWRNSYWFEIKKDFYGNAIDFINKNKKDIV